MEDREWTRLPVISHQTYTGLGVLVVFPYLIVMFVKTLLNPPHPSLVAQIVLWLFVAFYLFAIPVVTWKLIHLATSVRLADESIDVGILFFFHRIIARRNVRSVKCRRSKYNEPDCRIAYRGGYFDVYLPQDERRDDLVRKLMELWPQSSA